MPERQAGGVIPYDREVLVTILVYHWRTDTSGCGCGWKVLGKSHPEHIANVYEESMTALAGRRNEASS